MLVNSAREFGASIEDLDDDSPANLMNEISHNKPKL